MSVAADARVAPVTCACSCVVGLLLLGCTGDIGAPADSSPGGRASSGPSGAVDPRASGRPSGPAGSQSGAPSAGVSPDVTRQCQASESLFPRPLARLSAEELDNAFEDLLADKSRPVPETANEGTFGGFKAALSPVNRTTIEEYVSVVDDLTGRAVAIEKRKQWMSCDPAVAGCVVAWLKGFLPRAFRGPVIDADVQQLASVYDGLKGQIGPDEALRSVVKSILLSPRFLFHLESGESKTAEGSARLLKLRPHEIAARLSFFLWRSVPDARLVEAADKGQLTNTATLEAEVTRMMGDPKFRRSLGSFAGQWIRVADKSLNNLQALDTLTPTLATALRNETSTFFAEVVVGQGGVKELLTAPYSFLTAALATHYGESATATGRVEFTKSPRAGLLTQGSVLAMSWKPAGHAAIFRGSFVRKQLMCRDFPPPPDGAEGLKVDRMTEVSCKGCHTLLDPVGAGFERYMSNGTYRERAPTGQPIAARGELLDRSFAFESVRDLGSYLAGDADVHACMTEAVFKFALREEIDPCAKEKLSMLSASGGSLASVMKAIALSSAFATRALSQDRF